MERIISCLHGSISIIISHDRLFIPQKLDSPLFQTRLPLLPTEADLMDKTQILSGCRSPPVKEQKDDYRSSLHQFGYLS